MVGHRLPRLTKRRRHTAQHVSASRREHPEWLVAVGQQVRRVVQRGERPPRRTVHLLLHDRPMSVAEVSRLRLKYAELAYLSACSTARSSAGLTDEAIHIASAFQLAGYRHVVGALWPLEDATAAGVAEGFYSHLTNGTSPADALHVVIRSMRDEQSLTPSQWAAYVHAGP